MSEKINITIVGAAGKMGCELIRQISNSSNYNLVAAIVDWELCTLGDPLADLGTVIASWSNKNETDTPFIYSPSLSDGFPNRQEIINLYESKSDLNLSTSNLRFGIV